jgi:hypothetical protein
MLPLSFVVSALTGCAWGVLAYRLFEARLALAVTLGAGLIVGIVTGQAAVALRNVRWPVKVMWSVVVLYVAVSLFGALLASYRVFVSSAVITSLPVVWMDAAVTLSVALTLSGLLCYLAPLSLANHCLIWWVAAREDRVLRG